MKTICQIGVIFGVCWVSEILESLLPFSFPASVIAMVLLLALLLTGLLKLERVQELSHFLLANMAILFLPSLAGIMEYAEVLGQYLVPLLRICVVSTVLTFAATARSVRAVLALRERGKGRG